MSTIELPDVDPAEDPPRRHERPSPDDAPPILPSEQSRPFGDAVPAPKEPGLDQPLPPKTQPADAEPPAPQARPDEPPDLPPEDINVPIGDAVPAPTEPGLDQPLPEKKSLTP
ncbi:hypothetical protein [Paraburkholderia bannensis]|uniref:hypothetical protein n=1 Tax=Paraburkholderia bannensis TaxID=765414 RepID=UPI0005A6D523|nr:hypothetical protein [Paraburkholderia bannensis]